MNGQVKNGSEKCVSWDFKANNGGGGWTDAGCKKVDNIDMEDENMITCECNHLTNIAVLVVRCLNLFYIIRILLYIIVYY